VVFRRTIVHTPRVVSYSGPIRYYSPRDYYTHVSRVHIYRRWVQEPVIFTYSDGYNTIENYPYYVHRGYRYRYNPVELCQYELVDGDSYSTQRRFQLEACTTAYDSCAAERDQLNNSLGVERYFCAEAVDEDLAETETEVFQPAPVEMTPAKIAAISAFLEGKSMKDLFNEAKLGNCGIFKIGRIFSSGNEFNCKYILKVEGLAFPMTDESVCSEASAAQVIGCNVGTQQENIGCIFKQAIEAGYCL
jgi:hypothetical protein